MKGNKLDIDVQYLKGVGPARSRQLARLGIRTVWDLLFLTPREYLDRREMTPVSELAPGGRYNVSGEIVSSGMVGGGRGRRRFQAVLREKTGEIILTFFNYRFIIGRLTRGVRVVASGKVDFFGGLSMVHPQLLFPEEEHGDTELVLPVYPLTQGMTQTTLRGLVRKALEHFAGSIPEVLPPEVLRSKGYRSREEALGSMHFPPDPASGGKARRLLALEEFIVHQSLLQHVRARATVRSGIPMPSGTGSLSGFLDSLPYRLTAAQTRALSGIRKDMSRDVPMRRLLQGDVGSGKTVVAAAACLICSISGHQAVVVAPTEVLAAQHHRSLSGILESRGVSCGLLTGGTGTAERRRLLGDLETCSLKVLIGTHAVLEDTVRIPRLGLCVIDEQHKFGVAQRDRLISERDPSPHFLLMSATPIPRTLAMSLYGDLDLSIIDEMPPGRGRTFTRVMDRDDRSRVYDFLLGRLSLGERAYVVYPLREASEELDLRDAASACEILSRGPLGRFGVGLLTGAMSSQEKLDVTGRFVSGEISVLVSTTVVEVGLDVPQATVMVIAHADRFGLSQLHQLRGRIGRGDGDSWCFLMRDEKAGPDGRQRLDILASTGDGFRIAEEDLRLRGPGEVAGTRQHGIPSFRVASLTGDADLLAEAAELASLRDCWEELREEYVRRFGSPDVPEI